MNSAAAARARRAPALYLITDRHATGGRPLPEVVARALEGMSGLPRAHPGDAGRTGGGAPLVTVQLREKDLDAGALLALARALRPLTAAAGAGLYVNDRVDVALAAGADGVHLGGGSLTVGEVQAIAPGLGVAISAHRLADLEALADSSDLQFAVFGPLFDTPSKRRYGPPVGPARLAEAAARFPAPILALGGVDLLNAEICLTAGAHGLACIRAVLAADDPAEALRSLLKKVLSYWDLHFGEDLT